MLRLNSLTGGFLAPHFSAYHLLCSVFVCLGSIGAPVPPSIFALVSSTSLPPSLSASRRITLTPYTPTANTECSYCLLHSEISRFIANARLHARIDRVNGIVETTRPSLKSAQYDTVVRQGDVLLNEVQRLSKVLY